MTDFAPKNYRTKALSNKTLKGFVITLCFILGGLAIVVVDHIGHDLQASRATQTSNH